MTTPLAHGYPDWTRQTPASDVVFSAGFGHVAATFTQLGPFFTGAAPAVGVFFRANGDAFRVQPTFWADQSKTQFLASQALEFSAAGTEYRGAIRAVGPWMTLDVTPLAGAGTFDWTLWQAPTPGTIFGNATESVLVSASQAIAIGATFVGRSNRLHPGVAHLYAAQRAGIYDCNLYSVDSLGTRTILQRRQMAAGTFFSEMVALGSGTPQVEITNTSGAAQVIDVMLVAVPNLTG